MAAQLLYCCRRSGEKFLSETPVTKIAFLSHYSLSILTNSSPDLPPAPGKDREEQGGGGGAGDAAGGGQARG